MSSSQKMDLDVNQIGERLFFGLDVSTKQIGANTIRTNSGDTWSGIATGKGVIVAIIDSGINYEHNSFRNADKTTRIIGILDLSLDGTVPHPDGGTGINLNMRFTDPATNRIVDIPIDRGVEYTQNNIRDALSGGTKLRHKDTNGHGTHVAGIAAGNGFQRDRCSRFYPGVAPEADILVIKLGNNGSQIDILAGVAYAIHIATRENKAVVINLSSSRDLNGAHEGNAGLELDIDFMLDHHLSNKNVSFVTIAGNSANHDNHATTEVPAGGAVTLNFKILDARPNVIEIWYPGTNNNQLGFVVDPPVLLESTPEIVPSANQEPTEFPFASGGSLSFASALQALNGFQRILIGIIPPRP
jgi:hypothetical protein